MQRLPGPHLTHLVRLFLHRSRPRSSAKAPAGGLKPPPARRLRRSRTSSIYSHSTASTELPNPVPRSCSQGHQLRQRHAGLPALLASRPFLEGHVRERVFRLPNVRVLDGHAADGLTAAPGG